VSTATLPGAIRPDRHVSFSLRAVDALSFDSARHHGERLCHDRQGVLAPGDEILGVLFGINFAMGVATGITMEFQFGMN
jgi:hypothetical protein